MAKYITGIRFMILYAKRCTLYAVRCTLYANHMLTTLIGGNYIDNFEEF